MRIEGRFIAYAHVHIPILSVIERLQQLCAVRQTVQTHAKLRRFGEQCARAHTFVAERLCLRAYVVVSF